MFEDGYPQPAVYRQPAIFASLHFMTMLMLERILAAYAGWEYPDWFAPKGVEPKVEYSWGRQNWFEYSAAEHRAARENVTLMDYSVMGKILVQGRDAEKYLNRICANNVAVPVGKMCLHPMVERDRHD